MIITSLFIELSIYPIRYQNKIDNLNYFVSLNFKKIKLLVNTLYKIYIYLILYQNVNQYFLNEDNLVKESAILKQINVKFVLVWLYFKF